MEEEYSEYKKWYFSVHPSSSMEDMARELHSALVEHYSALKAAQHLLHTDAASAAAKTADTAPTLSPVKPAGSQAAPVS